MFNYYLNKKNNFAVIKRILEVLNHFIDILKVLLIFVKLFFHFDLIAYEMRIKMK